MRTLLFFLLVFPLLASDAAQAAQKPFTIQVSGNPKGLPMILIPGLSSAGAVYDDTVAKYCGDAKAKYQCHTLTLAGFAGVPALPDGPLLPGVRDALVDYIQANKLVKPIFIGHSLGGHMALWIASMHPDLTGKLIIVDSLPHLGTFMFPDPTTLHKQAEGMKMMIVNQTKEQYGNFIKTSGMLTTLVTPEAQLARVTEWGMSSSPVAVGNAMFDLYTTDLREEVAKITAKTLVLCSWIGYKEFNTKASTMVIFEKQYAKLKDVKLAMSDTAKHFIMLDEPAWYFDQIDAFLK
jgi:pimeloyl-ACP methyl ester carboxylesterase